MTFWDDPAYALPTFDAFQRCKEQFADQWYAKSDHLAKQIAHLTRQVPLAPLARIRFEARCMQQFLFRFYPRRF